MKVRIKEQYRRNYNCDMGYEELEVIPAGLNWWKVINHSRYDGAFIVKADTIIVTPYLDELKEILDI